MSRTIELESIRRLDIKPGETLVVRVPTRDTAAIREARDGLIAALPRGVKVLVIGPDVDLSVLCPSSPA